MQPHETSTKQNRISNIDTTVNTSAFTSQYEGKSLKVKGTKPPVKQDQETKEKTTH
jgi:hypothetical protein